MRPEELQDEQGEEQEQEEQGQPEQQLEEHPEQLVEAVQDVVEVSSDEGTMVQAPPRQLVQYALKDFFTGKDRTCHVEGPGEGLQGSGSSRGTGSRPGPGGH